MITTSYGYKKPEAGDRAKGVTGWYAALNFNTDRLNTHNHDGVNSALLSPASFSTYSNSILAAGWVADGASYKQTVTVPAGVLEVNNFGIKFVFTAPAGKVGEIAYLNYKRLSGTTFELYCNDNTAAFTAYYR